MICEYGCGRTAQYQFKNGKWCCNKYHSQCPKIIETIYKKNVGHIVTQETRDKISKANEGRVYSSKSIENFRKGQLGKKLSQQHRKNISIGIKNSEKHKNKVKSKEFRQKISKGNKGKLRTNSIKKRISLTLKLTIDQIKERYKFFSKIEEMRYNSDKPEEKEIQVHCKNYKCKNSKEKGGWFTPSYIQLYERIRQLEKDYGNGGCYLYCSDECKNSCVLYYLKSDPHGDLENPYTQEEYQTFRQFVLERDDYKCQYCGKKATEVHHERPQKLEPFFSLDPDFAWSCCEKCHYEKGHKDECSTGKLSSIICR